MLSPELRIALDRLREARDRWQEAHRLRETLGIPGTYGAARDHPLGSIMDREISRGIRESIRELESVVGDVPWPEHIRRHLETMRQTGYGEGWLAVVVARARDIAADPAVRTAGHPADQERLILLLGSLLRDR